MALERACEGKGLVGLEYGDDVWAMGEEETARRVRGQVTLGNN